MKETCAVLRDYRCTWSHCDGQYWEGFSRDTKILQVEMGREVVINKGVWMVDGVTTDKILGHYVFEQLII